MNRKSIFRAIMAMVLGLAMVIVFIPALGQADKAYAKTATSLELVSTEGFTLPIDDPDIDYMPCHLYEDGQGDVLVVHYDDNTSVEFYCTDDEYWEFTSAAGQTITLSTYGWVDEPDEFEVGESYDAYIIVGNTGGVEGVSQYQALDPYVSVKIVNDEPSVFIDSISLSLNSGEILQLTETDDGFYDAFDVLCHEGDKLTVNYSNGTTETITADEDGDFYNEDDELISIYFEWVEAEGLEFDDDGNLKGKTGETYDAYVHAYKRISTHTSGEEVYAKDENDEFATFPVTIVGYEWDIDYEWAEDNSSVTATAVRKDDPDITKTETVDTTSEITKYPTDTEMGETTYTAVFTQTPFENQEKTVANIPLRDYVVTGGTEGTDYTYLDGVLKFLKDGDYTVRMRTGVEVADDKIEIHGGSSNPGFNNMKLTLDNLNIDTGDNIAVEGFFGGRTNDFNLNVILKGTNVIKSNTLTWKNHSFASNFTLEAESGTASDSLLIENGEINSNDNDFSVGNFTQKSGKFSFDASRSTVTGKEIGMTANKTFLIESGELYVNSPDPAGALYCNHQFVMTGGDVTVETSGTRCIQVVGVADVAGDGVLIKGGDLHLTSTGTRGAGTISTGNSKYKNIIFDTDGIVEINSKYIGIFSENRGSIDMKRGTLKVSGIYGIYIPSAGDGPGGVTFSGGESEFICSTYGMVVNGTPKVDFDEDYIHKDYTGESKETRVETADANVLNGSASKKYVLITPAYPITYDLNDGELDEGVTNPEVYTRVDNITLNNPSKEGYDFIGWTGTGLDDPTEAVTIPIEGVTGALSFEANYKIKEFEIQFDAGEGASEVPAQTIEYGSKIDKSLVDPEKDGYTLEGWYEDEELTKPFDLDTPITDALTLHANWTENKAAFQYLASQGGTVSPKNEEVGVITGQPAGSTAAANEDYEFVCWTNSQGLTVGEEETFVPQKTDGKYVSETYIANFREKGSGGGIAVIVPPPEMTYTGEPQTAYSDTDGYTVENGTATDAGTHTAVLTLKDGYTWSDGTTDSKEITYKIEKATLTAEYVGETIEWYETPAMEVKVTGFINGETAETAKGYEAPKVETPECDPHTTYTITPSDGSATNYTFEYVSGELIVNCKAIIIATVKDGKSKATLTWTEVPGATGYKVYGSKCGKTCKLKVTVEGQELETTVNKLKKACYKFYVVAYREQGGETLTLAKSPMVHAEINNALKKRSNPTGINVDKTSVTIKKNGTDKIKGKIVCKKKPLGKGHNAIVRYLSSDIHIATVDKNGNITGERKGECEIYVFTQNGIWKTVHVTVE